MNTDSIETGQKRFYGHSLTCKAGRAKLETLLETCIR